MKVAEGVEVNLKIREQQFIEDKKIIRAWSLRNLALISSRKSRCLVKLYIIHSNSYRIFIYNYYRLRRKQLKSKMKEINPWV